MTNKQRERLEAWRVVGNQHSEDIVSMLAALDAAEQQIERDRKVVEAAVAWYDGKPSCNLMLTTAVAEWRGGNERD